MSLPTAVPAPTAVPGPDLRPAPDGPAGAVLRLRPIVHASPVASGLHVRGWTSSFTVDGGPGLWRLWRALAAALSPGEGPERLAALSGREPVRAAVQMLLAQLREHDMLVTVPAGWDRADGAASGDAAAPDAAVARWLEAVAPDPAAAWARIRATEVAVDGGGRLAAAAARALGAAGVPVRRYGGDHGRTVLRAGSLVVEAGADGDVGYAGPPVPGPLEDGTRPGIAARLGITVVDGPDAETPVLAALVGGVAAHRLLCAVAGLPDPGSDHLSPGADRPWDVPAVFVARLDPLRGGYHPWPGAGCEDGDGANEDGDGANGDGRLDRALGLVEVLTDPELGPLPPVRIADLPQVPAGLVALEGPAGTAVGIGVTVDVARLLAVLGAGEPAADGTVTAVGADRRHADGVALRRAARRASPDGPPLGEACWSGSPVARQWWKALTLRFGVPARVEVVRLADGVHRASVRTGGGEPGWAVEADPADAAAFALLAAVGAEQWRAATGRPGTVFAPCGATPAPPVADRTRVPWLSGAWAWPAPLADAEPALQHRLRLLTGATPQPVAGALPGVVTVRVPAGALRCGTAS